MSNLRHKVVLTFGHDSKEQEKVDNFKRSLVEAISSLYGGCTILPTEGAWVEGAEETKEAYGFGKLAVESGFRIEVTFEATRGLDKELGKIQAHAKFAKRQSEVRSIQWVDCNTSTVYANHFEI